MRESNRLTSENEHTYVHVRWIALVQIDSTVACSTVAGNLHVFFGEGIIVGQFGPVRDVHQSIDDDVFDTAGENRFSETVGLEHNDVCSA